jgi:cation transport regulator
MPYVSNEDLPAPVRHVLPAHAQDIYRATFNNAYDRYGGDENRARRIAWAAVKRRYEKVGTVWIEKPHG